MAASSSSSVRIVPKANTVSPVWTYFGLEADGQGKLISKEIAICRVCNSRATTKGGSTSNLFSHLKNHHPKEYAILKSASRKPAKSNHQPSSHQPSSHQPSSHQPSSSSQPTLVSVVDKLKPYNRDGKKWQDLTDSITFCLCKDMLPIYTVEKPGFQRMLRRFDPQYQLPSRKYFSETAIPKLYNLEKERVVAELSLAKSFAATTDMWSSETGQPFLSYTVHFIDNEWKLRTYCLQALYLPVDHTASNIADACKGLLVRQPNEIVLVFYNSRRTRIHSS